MESFIIVFFLFPGVFSYSSVDLEKFYNLTGCMLPVIENGHYAESWRFVQDQSVQIICNDGFQLFGESVVQCNQSTGNTTIDFQQCRGCEIPVLENGVYRDVSKWFDRITLYSFCKPGFRQRGENLHVCNLTTGTYTNNNVTCEDIDECTELGADGQNVTCDVNAMCHNTIGSYDCICKDGYLGNGSYCRLEKNCEPLAAPKNGRVDMYTRYALFRCDKGYIMFGNRKRRCRRKKWTGVQPWCEVPDGACPQPPPLENGYQLGSSYTLGSQIRHLCNDQFILEGPAIRTCTRNGWTGINPYCDTYGSSVADIAKSLKEKLASISSGSKTARLYQGGSQGADIIFMVDRSNSIHSSNFDRIRQFIMMIIEEFGVDNPNPKNGGSRVALVTFGSKVKVVFKLSNKTISTPEQVRQILGNVQSYGGETALLPAIEKVYTRVAGEARESAQKALFIIADGQSTVKDNLQLDPKYIIRDLKTTLGYEIFVVGVGRLKNIENLRKYSTKPYRKHFFILEDFQDLQRLKDIVVQDKESPTCGKGGNIKGTLTPETAADKDSWPWLGLVYDNKQKDVPVCGGALICKNWFLTASSCATGKHLSVDLGVYDLFENPMKRLTVISKFIHPDNKDLALLQFNDSTTENMFSIYIQPVCLRERGGSGLEYLTSNTLWVAGRGVPKDYVDEIEQVPIYTELPVVNSENCGKSLHGPDIPDDMFCAGFRLIQDKACRGDVGTPLVHAVNGRFEVVGVASKTEYCPEINQYSLFTETTSSNVINWIHEVTDGCNIRLHDNIPT